MSIRKLIIGVVAIIAVTLTSASSCKPDSKKETCGTPHPAPAAQVVQAPSAPECSLPPVRDTVDDGIWIANVDIPTGRWQSVRVPDDIKDCVWFVTASDLEDPATQNLPAYTDHRPAHYQIEVVLKPHQGLVTSKCGPWKLISKLP